MRARLRKFNARFSPFYGQLNRSAEAAIRPIVTKFRIKFTLLDIKPPTSLRKVRTEEHIAALPPVLMMTINYLFVAVRSNWISVTHQRGKFLQNDLGVNPFKIQLMQELKLNDLTQHRIFGE